MSTPSSSMTFAEYSTEAHKTAIYPIDNCFVGTAPGKRSCFTIYPFLGLAGEVGELMEKLKKRMRDGLPGIGTEFTDASEAEANWRGQARKELGDALWYLSECADSLGSSLDEIARENIEKLRSRQQRGMLQGSGDNR